MGRENLRPFITNGLNCLERVRIMLRQIKIMADSMQETFLNDLAKSQAPVFCFLVNGIKLEGFIIAYDQFSVMLASNRDAASSQLIMKSAISTIVPKGTGSVVPKTY